MKYGMACTCVILTLAVSPLAFCGQAKSVTLPPDNAVAELKPGPAAEAVRANCVACHSTDYIVRQPPSEAKQWEAEVKKMMSVFGAPISEGDARIIVDYLASAYGPHSEAPPATPSPKERAGGKPPRTRKAANH